MPNDPLAAFLEASVWHGSLDEAEAILVAHPELASSSIHTAAILGDDAAVRRFLAQDPKNATAKDGHRGWDALTYLCFSKYLRLDHARSESFMRAATALLDAGASAKTGFFCEDHQPQPEFESALYGAAGVAHHAELTRILIERGADPNDGEVAYHTPETSDNRALKVLVESGKVTGDSLVTMLLRKADWHDYDGIKWLLEHGDDPNRMTHWGFTALHQAVRRDNALEILELLPDHGADPTLLTRNSASRQSDNKSAIAIAARRGRGNVLELFERRGFPIELHGIERLIAACARNDSASAHAIAGGEPNLLRELLAQGGKLVAEFAGNGNTGGVRLLLDLGVNAGALFVEGDGYWGVAKNSTALHVAAWRARHSTVAFLLERGAPVDTQDGEGRTPLALAVCACVDSFWTELRSPASVRTLLRAGASIHGVQFPSGYPVVDELLKAHGAKE